MNSCLSLAGLPRLPGYSKSRSRPSKSRVRRNSMLDVTKMFRVAFVANMAVILVVPKFQPPTARRTFSFGLEFFREVTFAYLKQGAHEIRFTKWYQMEIFHPTSYNCYHFFLQHTLTLFKSWNIKAGIKIVPFFRMW